MATGVIVQISVSTGGVPKHAIGRAIVWEEGLHGDRQADLRAHGGPERAVCLYSFEVIEKLRSKGDAVTPGATGENVTVDALDWSLVVPGVEMRLGNEVQPPYAVRPDAQGVSRVLSSGLRPMPDLTQFINAWGYAAIFLVVVLGNVGLPVPEETVLTVGGYLAWHGHLRFPVVVLTAIVSAVTGDNIGYWLGRRYGQRILGRLTAVTASRAERARAFILRYGAMAVFAARFVTGLRFMAGPLAGSTGLPPGRFFIANLLGAVVYAPLIVGAGYAIGYGVGDSIERLRREAGDAERVVLVALVLAAIIVWIARARRARRRSG